MALNISSTDIELMQRVSSNDSKALEVFYNRYSSLLYTLIKKIVSEEKTAEDILSEIFVIIWRKVDQFDFNTGNVYTWLVTLARNKAVDSLKRLQLPERQAGRIRILKYIMMLTKTNILYRIYLILSTLLI